MKPTTFGELGTLFDGPHATPTRRGEGPYFLNISSLVAGRLDLAASDHVSEQEFSKWTRRVTPQAGDLLFSYETRLGEAALMPEGIQACLGRRMALLRPNRELIEPRFLLYFYLSPPFQETIQQRSIHGATVERILLSTMGDWPVEVPELGTQRAIAEVLGALDDKIAANSTLAGGAKDLIRANLSVARGHGERKVLLAQLVEFHNRKRVPLSSRERDIRRGNVPYWGANGVLGHVDVALFNEPLVLVGEDGTVETDEGHPVVHYVWGPTWVNNHAHVLTGRGVSTELLRYLVEAGGVSPLITGAVQPKLSMGNLKKLELVLPVDGLDRVEAHCLALQKRVVACAEESRHLATLRDTLLPHLMSGRLAVREAEARVEAAL